MNGEKEISELEYGSEISLNAVDPCWNGFGGKGCR